MTRSARLNSASSAAPANADLGDTFRQIAELRGDVAWVVDAASGLPTYISASVIDVLGYSVADIHAHLAGAAPLGALVPLCAGLDARLQRWRDGDLSRTRVERQFELRHPDGRAVPVELVSVILSDGAGAAISVAGTLRDVSAERARARRFASMLNHEFRTPLSTIDGAIQRLEATQTEADEPTRLRYRKIQLAVDRLIGMLDDYLSPERMDEIGQSRPDTSLAPAELLEEAASRLRAAGRAVTLCCHDLPMRLRCQPQALRLALKVLSDNVLSHAPSGPLTLTGKPAARGVEIALHDAGSGIPPAELEAIFAKGVRGSNASAPGSGLGLYMARSVMEVQGGNIVAENGLKQGAVFKIWLPYQPEAGKSVAPKVNNSDNSANNEARDGAA